MENWWKESVIYQIYPRSYADSNGDGVGDLKGIIQKLDYIRSLGVDAIWLNPFFKSPNDDGGYDVSDYRDIQPEFGTMQDFDQLMLEAHSRGIRIIIDLVLNHSSDEHKWFQEALKSPDSPFRSYYFWKKGKENLPPSNWPSFFGGSAWEYSQHSDEYYLHLFSRKQPDLNWENPVLRKELYEITRFWLDKGVDGIRLDVISAISKRTNFPDADTEDFNQIIARFYSNGPRLKEYISEMRKEVFQNRSILTVGEGPGIHPGNAMNYLDKVNGLDLIFHFGHMFLDQGPGGRFDPVPWSLDSFIQVFLDWEKALNPDGWGSIFLGNHDFARQVSRWGNDQEYHAQSAKALFTLMMSLRGTPFVFAGDEIGMTNIKLEQVAESRDVETLNGFKSVQLNGVSEKDFLVAANYAGRDNARTPFQWNDQEYAGFSSHQPWMKVNPNKSVINQIAQEHDANSILNYFRRMVAFRKSNKALVYGSLVHHRMEGQPVFCFDRHFEGQTYRIAINFSNQKQDFNKDHDDFILQMNNLEQFISQILLPWQALIWKK
jgi:oligo-1,6-glucosidase